MALCLVWRLARLQCRDGNSLVVWKLSYTSQFNSCIHPKQRGQMSRQQLSGDLHCTKVPLSVASWVLVSYHIPTARVQPSRWPLYCTVLYCTVPHLFCTVRKICWWGGHRILCLITPASCSRVISCGTSHLI